jgi:hypothetical protein
MLSLNKRKEYKTTRSGITAHYLETMLLITRTDGFHLYRQQLSTFPYEHGGICSYVSEQQRHNVLKICTGYTLERADCQFGNKSLCRLSGRL